MGSLFCAGYIPGIMLGVFHYGHVLYHFQEEALSQRKKAAFLRKPSGLPKDTFFAMLAMVIIIGGVFMRDFFTATESAAVSCIYCLFVGFFHIQGASS